MPRPLPPDVVAASGGNETDAVRDHILDAAHRVIVGHGLAAASTRAIATEAGIGAGTVYNYFANRLDLVAKAIVRRVHALATPLDDLAARAGDDTIAVNLQSVAARAATILDEMVPLFAAAFAEPDLLEAVHHELARGDTPLEPAAPVERYLIAEQKLGRIQAEADCRAAATTVISLCHDRAFHRFFVGETARPASLEREIAFIARALTG